MGLSFNVAFDKTVSPYGKLGPDHSALGSAVLKLDEIATKRCLPTLSQFQFIDIEEMAETFGLDPSELGPPATEWHDASAGISALQALCSLLRSETKVLPKSAAVLAELEAVEQELIAAQKRKAKFHFCLLD